jgi:hypothetical protein
MRAEQLLRLFPRAWRERYGEEFLATAGDERLRLSEVIDIIACAIDARSSREVRRVTDAVDANPVEGGCIMPRRLSTSCGSTVPLASRRDAVIGALVMIAGSLLFSAAGVILKRQGHVAAGESLVSIAFFASLLLMMPFTYLKGRSWRVQLVLVGLPMLLLVAIALSAQLASASS